MAFRKVHGRRLGRPLNQERQEALDKLYPALSIDSEVLDNSSNLLPSSLFEKAPEVSDLLKYIIRLLKNTR